MRAINILTRKAIPWVEYVSRAVQKKLCTIFFFSNLKPMSFSLNSAYLSTVLLSHARHYNSTFAYIMLWHSRSISLTACFLLSPISFFRNPPVKMTLPYYISQFFIFLRIIFIQKSYVSDKWQILYLLWKSWNTDYC